MFKFKQSYKDAKKCSKVLESCQNFGQLNTAMNMIFNYGKMYNYNWKWSKLDQTSHRMWFDFVDRKEYEARIESIKDEDLVCELLNDIFRDKPIKRQIEEGKIKSTWKAIKEQLLKTIK